jgi:hypothetical protein
VRSAEEHYRPHVLENSGIRAIVIRINDGLIMSDADEGSSDLLGDQTSHAMANQDGWCLGN